MQPLSIGLVLEGGGMRGWYTGGVLTALSENGIAFPVVYGISAGALNALDYISGQNTREQAAEYIKYAADERYVSVNNLRRTGSIFDFDFMFGEMYHRLVPFDYGAFFRSPIELKAGATDLKTGEAVFFGKADMDENFTPVRASCSLPMVCNTVSFRGHELLDGGCAMPIPVERSIFDGNQKNVIVLTRDASYRKSARPEFPRAVLHVRYGAYPRFIEAMMRRPETYNSELEVCRRLEREGRAFVIRPSVPLVTSRYEKHPEKLHRIYELGIRDCEAKLGALREFLRGGESPAKN